MDRITQEAMDYIRTLFQGNADGHGFEHSFRVWRNAMMIAETEQDCNRQIVSLAALLHDTDDHKLFMTENNANARRFLEAHQVPTETTEKICAVINDVSFSKNRGKHPGTPESRIVQDADRLDAIGAVGIARTFAYGGKHGRAPEESIAHFHEKLLLLKDMMNTEKAKALAEQRHTVMEDFLREWEAETGMPDQAHEMIHPAEPDLTEGKMIKAVLYDAKEYDRPSFEHYGSLNGIRFRFLETKLNEDTVDLAKGSDAVCVFVNDTVNSAVIDRLYQYGVKLIALRSAGYNNVDLQAAFGKVHVVHVPAYSPYAVAEHAMALLLTSVRRIHKAYNRTREFNFSLNGLTGFDFHGKTVGVIGTGKIGRIFIDICRGFGMKVIAYDLFPVSNSDIQYVTLDELFKQSDIISLHCPLTDDTRHMIDAAAISKMKKGVVIVNTSRGGLINAEALLDGIKARKVGAACLDVYEEEADVFFEDRSGHILNDDLLSRLISMPNVIVTSHQAFLTEEALNNIAETTVNNIVSCFRNDGMCDNELCYRCGKIEQCKKERKEKCF